MIYSRAGGIAAGPQNFSWLNFRGWIFVKADPHTLGLRDVQNPVFGVMRLRRTWGFAAPERLFASYVKASNGWGVALHGGGGCSVEEGEQGGVVGAAEEGAQVFARGTGEEVAVQQADDGVRAVFGGGAIADLAGDAGVLDRKSVV